MRSADAVEECLTAFIGHRLAVEDDKEIDRAKVLIDDRRAANLRPDAEVHIEEARKLDRFTLYLFYAAKVKSIAAGLDAEVLVKMSGGCELMKGALANERVAGKDRTAAKQISFVRKLHKLSQAFPEQVKNLGIAMLGGDACTPNLDAILQDLSGQFLDAELPERVEAIWRQGSLE